MKEVDIVPEDNNMPSESQVKALNKLCENLDMTAVLMQLEKKGHLSTSEVQAIKDEITDHNERRKLIDLIIKKPVVCGAFQEALLSSGQIRLAELLSKTLSAGSMSLMHHYHPEWWSDSTSKDTICIPVSLDVDKNRYLGASDCKASNFNSETFSRKERQWSGQAAEDIFIKAFQKLNVGGVLIFGFDTMEFASLRRMQKLFKKRSISQIECDFIFIHPSIGIFVIELKATKQTIEECSPVYQHAVRMTKKIKEQIPIIYELLTGRKFNIPLHGAVCFPQANVAKFPCDETVELIKSFNDSDPQSLQNVLMNKVLQNSLDEETLNGLKMFASSLAAYRSVESISPVHNALAIHAMMESQSYFVSKAKGAELKNDQRLTDEQLAVIDCQDRHQIISGPPGTAKTLILLNKARNAAKTEKPGRVCIVTFNKACCKVLERHFDEKKDGLMRFPIVNHTLNDATSEDDLFIDEADLQSEEIISLLKDRHSASGLTVVAVTGYQRPQQIINVAQDIKDYKLTFYRHFDMRTVVRGTVSIVDTWKQEYPTNFRFHIGHSIIGPSVRKMKLKSTEAVLSNLQQHVSPALCSTTSKNLCIITESRNSCDIIKEFFGNKQICCGSLEEQHDDPEVIAVVEYTETLSLEWALVFVVTLERIHYYNSFIMIAASRATAKLVIIEND